MRALAEKPPHTAQPGQQRSRNPRTARHAGISAVAGLSKLTFEGGGWRQCGRVAPALPEWRSTARGWGQRASCFWFSAATVLPEQ